MNEHLKEGWKDHLKKGYRCTYVYDFGERDDGIKGFVYALRVPGATRGYFYTDENHIIVEIGFYEEQCYGDRIGCYERTLETVKEKFVGWKLAH